MNVADDERAIEELRKFYRRYPEPTFYRKVRKLALKAFDCFAIATGIVVLLSVISLVVWGLIVLVFSL